MWNSSALVASDDTSWVAGEAVCDNAVVEPAAEDVAQQHQRIGTDRLARSTRSAQHATLVEIEGDQGDIRFTFAAADALRRAAGRMPSLASNFQ